MLHEKVTGPILEIRTLPPAVADVIPIGTSPLCIAVVEPPLLVVRRARIRDEPTMSIHARLIYRLNLSLKPIRMWRTFQYGVDNFVDRNAIHYLVLL